MKAAPLVVLTLLSVLIARAEKWPAWRGPTGQGLSSDKNLPIHWSTNENVRWRLSLPERGNSTPIVWKHRVYLTQSSDAGKKRALLSINRKTGKIIWEASHDFAQTELTHETNPTSSSSPVTDGKHIYAFFGTAGLYCYDMDGKQRWHRDLGAQRHIWGYGSSPVVHGDVVYLNFGPGPRQFLIAMDKKTGATLWEKTEPGGASGEETKDQKPTWVGSWSTPLFIKADGDEQLLLSWPERLAAYDPKSGRELWTCRGLNPLSYASPLYADGIAVAMGGFNGKDLAVKTDGRGDVTDTHRIWNHEKTRQRIGSGAIHDGHIYMHTDAGIAECIDLKTGAMIWEERLKGPGPSGVNWSSVMIANGLCYTITQGGDCFVFKASPKFELVSTNSLREPSNSSIVPSDGQLFIRTHQALWCIENKMSSDPNPTKPGGGDLQFEKAEFTDTAALKCAICKSAIEGEFYQINGHSVCPTCRQQAGSEIGGGTPAARFTTAAGAGLLAAVGGLLLYWGVAQVARYWSVIAIAVGWMVGYAVNWGARGRGGVPYQTLAVILTYSTIAGSRVPYILRTVSGDIELMDYVEAFAYAATSPWTHGPRNIWLWVIIALALHQAWQMNRQVKLQIAGPFFTRQQGPPPAS